MIGFIIFENLTRVFLQLQKNSIFQNFIADCRKVQF